MMELFQEGALAMGNTSPEAPFMKSKMDDEALMMRDILSTVNDESEHSEDDET